MTIGVLLDSFKGTLTQEEATGIVTRVLREAGFPVVSYLVSDGGDGFLAAVASLFPSFVKIDVPCHDALGQAITAPYLLDPETQEAWIEAASTVGIARLSRLDVRRASSTGLGEMMDAACRAGARGLVIGLGGSATSDGGIGLLASLGYLPSTRLASPADLYQDAPLHARPFPVSIRALSDVTNPLLGPNGAASVYAPQKGASATDVEWLENGLHHFVVTNHKDEEACCAGAGAAGGIGFALSAFLGARLVSGADFLLDRLDYETNEKTLDLVIVGEGSLDRQSLMGKIVGTVARRTHHASLIALVGRSLLTAAEEQAAGLKRVYSLTSLLGSDRALTDARGSLALATQALARDLKED